MADVIEIVLALRNVSQFVSGAHEAAGAVGGIGDQAEKAGKQGQSGWKNLAKWAGGAAVFYGATRYIKGAVSATTDLAKSTLAVQRQTGMDTQTASEWVSLTKERGISASQLAVGLTKLNQTITKGATGTATASKTIADLRRQIDQVAAVGGKDAPKQLAKLSAQITKAEASGEKARATLAQLGVPLSELQKGDTAAVLGHVADALSKMTDPAQRSALAQQLLGRSGRALLPVLMQGQKGIDELLAKQKDYGNYLSGKSVKDTQRTIEQQRELETAMSGLKLQLGVGLLPVLIQLGKVLVAVARFMRPLTSNGKLLVTVLAAVTASVIALKTAIVVLEHWEAIAKVATALWTAAQWALNTAFLGFPVIAIIAAVVALGVAFVVAYKKVGWFRDAVNAAGRAIWTALKFVWDWVKKNWPLLVGMLAGPFGVAVALIITHFGTIKKTALAIVQAIRDAIQSLVSWVETLPGKLGGILKRIPGVKLASKALGKIGLAEGGIVTHPGGFVVGERGPEMVALPAGAAVSPIPAGSTIPGFGGRALEIVVPVVLDGKVLTRAVARVTADQLARK